jgi:hypothetical protein
MRYPALQWETKITRFAPNGDRFDLTTDETFTHAFADGVSITPAKHAIYGGLNPANAIDVADEAGTAGRTDAAGDEEDEPPSETP